MSQPVFYCALSSREAVEKTYGTASVGDTWLLVEYRQAWGAKAFQESALEPEVKKHLSRALKSLPSARLLFIKQDRPRPLHLNFFIVRCRERNPFIVKFQFDDYRELLKIDIARVAAERAVGAGLLVTEPLMLVCTHGRRDKCCAKFGYPLYKSLSSYAGESVWQSSHVGGDRFAANLVCFPHGLFYAHVTDEAARTIVDAYRKDSLVLDNYRGRACYPYPVQAAEFFIRREAGIRGLDELRYRGTVRASENSWCVSFNSPQRDHLYQAQITGRMSEFQNRITCHAAEERSVIQYSLDEFQSPLEQPASPG
jgi:hypothetical protein